ncbi:COG4973: Site-specific recombinase XerC [hydrothermal vent metagenome]|uniref:COG4973: Site-specific recombinase XerC n=1 Tax=hydrothermal vent metagenome TaxID=652676 RepID=A0A3B0XEV6_9ZZZZ
MRKHNVNNERIKRKYLTFLKQARGQNEASIDAVAKAISRFENYNKYKDFKMFHFEQAISFKKHLAKQQHHKTGKPLSLATLNSAMRHLKAFVQWLSQEAGYKSRISYSDAEYFNLSEKEARAAKAKRQKPVATIVQIKHVLNVLPGVSPIDKRDRALIAFILLTGARDSAVASMKIKHINFITDTVFQDAREVNTKFSKTFTTSFFPVGGEVRNIVYEWVEYLKNECLMGNDDPLFPKTKMSQNSDHNFQVAGLLPEHWSSAAAIRKIFKNAFVLAELPNFNPHSFRNTLAILGETLCHSVEEFKAWSQNLGHDGVLTTLYSYGEVQESRQADIFRQFREPRSGTAAPDVAELAKALAKEMAGQSC